MELKTKHTLPINRHFDCMKRCPMDCTTACKRFAYQKLVAALRECVEADNLRAFERGRRDPEFQRSAEHHAIALLRELGEIV